MTSERVESAVEACCGRGGAVLSALSDVSSIAKEDASFVAILVSEDELLPALVRVGPALAVGLLVSSGIERDRGEVEDRNAAAAQAGREANALLERLRAWKPATYVLNLGRVGGEHPGRTRDIGPGTLETLVDAARREVIEWETDPDFGWDHPSRIVEVGVMDDSAGPVEEALLCPRYLYAYSGGVYEYAALVPEVKKRRRVAAAELIGIDPEIDRALAGPEREKHRPSFKEDD